MTQAPPDADSLLTGSRYANRSLSFGELGAKPPCWHRNLRVAGRVETKQQTKVGTGEPLYFDDRGQKTTQVIPGSEVWQLVIPVWTEYQSQEIIDREGRDNGLRYLWVGGSKKPEKRTSRSALAGAMALGRAVSIHEVGARIDMGFVELGTPKPGQSAPRFYECTYTRPEPGWTPPEEYVPPVAYEAHDNGADWATSNGSGAAAVVDDQLDEEPPF